MDPLDPRIDPPTSVLHGSRKMFPFPYPQPYPQQLELMNKIYEAILNGSVGLFERSNHLLSAFFSYKSDLVRQAQEKV
jgi:hypothetical protein